MNGTVVLIAYYFPPLAGVASERAAAFARHLPALGWEPVVVAPRAGFYHRGEEAPPALEARVVRTASPEISRLLRRGWTGAADAGTEVRPVFTGRLGSALRRLVRDALYVPDARWPWIPFAARAAGRALRAGPGGRVVLSTSVPYSAHLAAWNAAASTGTPWVAEFRDPWSAADTVGFERSRARRALDRRTEAAILGRADRVVVTAEATRDLLLDAFGGLEPERVRVIPNGYEPPAPEEGARPPAPGEPLRLLYAGTVPDPAHLVPLLAGVASLPDEARGRVRLRVLGPAEPWRAAAAHAGVGTPPWLDLGGVVAPAEASRAARRSSALLLVLPDERYAAVVPGKVWEYLGARRPVLAAFPAGSETETLLEAHGDPRWLRPYTPERVAGRVAELLEEHASGRLQAPAVPAARVVGLTRGARAAAMARVLDEVSAGGRS